MSTRALKTISIVCGLGLFTFLFYADRLMIFYLNKRAQGASHGGAFTALSASDFLAAGISALTFTGLAAAILLEARLRATKERRLSHPPGGKLRRFAEFCFSKKTFTVILEPALSDMQKEHFEALAAGRPWKARMVLVRGYWAFWSAVAAQLPISLLRRVYEIWRTTKTGS